jgi:hypothetical protein
LTTDQKVLKNPGTRQRTGQSISPPLLLLLLACALEVLYLLIVALAPLRGLHLISSPLDAWSWTFVPSHLLFPSAWTPQTSLPEHDWPHLWLLGFTFIALTIIYAFALWTTLRIQDKRNISSRWLLFLLVGTVIFGVTLLFQPMLFSNDIFTYIFSGRILTTYHADPMNTVPAQFPNDPYLHWVVSGRNTPNVYGPFWLGIASLLVGLSNNPIVTLLLFKGVALFSHWLNTVLVWAILGRIAPTRRLLGTLLYAWHPLALIELAGSGHNEGILLTLLLLATWLHVQKKGRWHEIVVLALFGLAISTDLIAVLIAPLYTWFILRTEHDVGRAAWGFCWRMLVVLAVALMVILPFWRGPSTFLAITSTIDAQHFVGSPLGTLADPVRWLFRLVAEAQHFPPIMQPTTAADVTLRASAIFIFALIYIHLFDRVRHTPTIMGTPYSPDVDSTLRQPEFDVLLASWSTAIFWYLICVSGRFWPWYTLWALWVVALRCLSTMSISVLLLSSTALLTYPLLDFTGSPTSNYQPILIFGISLVYLLFSRKKQREEKQSL